MFIKEPTFSFCYNRLMHQTKITAHRGYSAQYPENTLLAFEKAVEAGAERIELDVHFSKDQQIIVHHDYYLGRTNNSSGLVSSHSYTSLKQLDAGSWFSPKFTDLKIPLLEEVLLRFGDKIEYEIELKGSTKEFVQRVVQTVNKYELADNVEYTSPHPFVLSKIRSLYPDSVIGMFLPRPQEWMGMDVYYPLRLDELILGDINVAHINIEFATPEFMQDLRQAKKLIHLSNCETKENLKKAFTLKSDRISTNDISLAVAERGLA